MHIGERMGRTGWEFFTEVLEISSHELSLTAGTCSVYFF